MGALLLILVIINAFATGWLLAQVKGMKRTIAGVARAQKDFSKHDYVYGHFDEDYEEE